MSDVKVNIAYSNVDFPPNTPAVDHIQVTLTGVQAGDVYTQSVAPGTPSVTFVAPNPDSYTVKVQAMDASNNSLAAKTDTIVVPAPPPVTLSVPSSISEQLI